MTTQEQVMSPDDHTTFDILCEAFGSEAPAADYRNRWQSAGRPGEGFAEYLVRQNVLVAGAAKTVEMVRKGYLTIEGRSLLTRPGATVTPSATPLNPRTLPNVASPTRIIRRSEIDPSTAAPSPTTRTTPGILPAPPRRVSSTTHATLDVATVGDAPAPAPRVGVGTRLGRCTLTRELGEGGGGTVYEASHAGLGIRVAVKVLRSADPRALAGLRAEARLLAHLNHVNLVRVFDFDDDGPVPHLVLELVEGLTLADLIAQSGGLRPDKAVRIVAAAAHGLDAAAGIGIIHRDVKPSNILLDKTGRVKVTDLGLAVSQTDQLTAATGATPADRAGGGGTAAYMAPERFGGRSGADVRTDIYSLGVTLFEAVTGRLPFDGRTAMELMVQHASDPVPNAHDMHPGVPATLSRVIARMMAKSPGDRHLSYQDLIDDLSRVAAGTASPTTADHPTTASGSWLVRKIWPGRPGGAAGDTHSTG